MNTQTMPLTLQDAINLQVKEFAETNQVFSIYDITRVIREKTGNGIMQIPEVEVQGCSYKFDIPHHKVKDIFENLRSSNGFNPPMTLSRQHNGTYWVYTPTITASQQSSITPSFVTPSAMSTVTSWSKESQSIVELRIKNYLTNCSSRNFNPTLKQVQSAIKRQNHSTGWSRSEIGNLISSMGLFSSIKVI